MASVWYGGWWNKARIAEALGVLEEEIGDWSLSEDGSVLSVRIEPRPTVVEISITRRPIVDNGSVSPEEGEK